METIIIILIIFGVAALVFAVWGVIRLSRRVNDSELMRMELIDFEIKFEKLEEKLDKLLKKI